MSIANRLAELLKAKSITQKQLAENINVSASTLNTWLTRGVDFPASYIMPICRALDVTPEYLLEGEEGEKARAASGMMALSDDEAFLVKAIRSLDREGVLMVLSKAIDEGRRLQAEQGGHPSEASGA